MNEVIIGDIETLATKKNAVVLSLGIVVVDLDKTRLFEDIVADSLEIIFETQPQYECGRVVDSDTLDWWSKQGESARRIFDAPVQARVHPRELYPYIQGELNMNAATLQRMKWYFRGPHFDAAILDTFCDDFTITALYKHYNVRDTRTWLECNGVDFKLEKPASMIPHNAAHDAAFDGWMMQQVLHNRNNLVQVAREAA